MIKKLFFMLVLLLPLTSFWLNLHKPVEPLKQEIKTIIKWDCESKQDFDFIFQDLRQSSKWKEKLKYFNVRLYLNTIKCDL